MTVEQQASGAAGFIRAMAGRESLSGPGSTILATIEIRDWLPRIIDRYNITSIADVPCGDWTWMSAVDLRGAEYSGYDLCPEITGTNQKRHPQHRFDVLNAIAEQPRKADLVLCRDMLVHLTLSHAMAVLENFRASGARYLAATNFPDESNVELPESWPGWGWRPLNMEAAPFLLGPPIDSVEERFFLPRWNRWTRLYEL